MGRSPPDFRRKGEDGQGLREDDTGRERLDHVSQSRHLSIRSRNDQLDSRSSHEALNEIEAQLRGWLTTHGIPFDTSQAVASSLLDGVFESHATLSKSNRRLEDRLNRRDAKIRGFEDDLKAAEQELGRLEQYYQNLLTQEYLERERQREAHEQAVGRLEHQHLVSIYQERQKVQQAEEDMRMSVDHFQALHDDELNNRFYKLATEIESLSRVPPAPDFIQQAAAMGMGVRVPTTMLPRDQKLLFHSILWAVLVDGIFCTPFRVFGAYGDGLHETWTALFSLDQEQHLEWPVAEPLAEKWRSTTVDSLRRALTPSANPQSQGQSQTQNHEIPTSCRHRFAAVMSRLLPLFSSSIPRTRPDSLQARLHHLLDQACHFAILIAQERCRVRVFLPTLSDLGRRTLRESADIKDVCSGNETEIPFAKAEFVVTPGLSKAGNSTGGKLEDRVVLRRALVFFSLDDSKG